jgi:hypothetical protein
MGRQNGTPSHDQPGRMNILNFPTERRITSQLFAGKTMDEVYRYGKIQAIVPSTVLPEFPISFVLRAHKLRPDIPYPSSLDTNTFKSKGLEIPHKLRPDIPYPSSLDPTSFILTPHILRPQTPQASS